MMSYRGALPVESESHILIDACLAQVRVAARLDDEPVLPPLHTIVRDSRLDLGPSAQKIPSADAIVKSVWRVSRANALDGAKPLTVLARPDTRSEHKPAPVRRSMRRLRWPVLFCGFVAGIFGGVAVMKSPVGKAAITQHIVKKVKSPFATAYAAGVTVTSNHAAR